MPRQPVNYSRETAKLTLGIIAVILSLVLASMFFYLAFVVSYQL